MRSRRVGECSLEIHTSLFINWVWNKENNFLHVVVIEKMEQNPMFSQNIRVKKGVNSDLHMYYVGRDHV